MSEFTKGEWKISRTLTGNWIDIINDKGQNIAEAKGYGVIASNEMEANAKLIAHAPRMLDMLKRFNGMNNIARSHLPDTWLIELEQLIQQATTI